MRRNYQIKFIKRINSQDKIYNICLVRRTKKSGLVLDKLGSYNKIDGVLNIDIFKLIKWRARHASITGPVMSKLEKLGIIRFERWQLKKI